MAITYILLLLIKTYSCESVGDIFKEINEVTTTLNAVGADIAWQSLVDPVNTSLPRRVSYYQRKKIAWQHNECKKLNMLHDKHILNLTQERQAYLLCRGPIYTYSEARKISKLYEDLQSIYSNAAVCIPYNNFNTETNITVLENAIMKNISMIQKYIKSDHDSIRFAVKLAVNNGASGICLKGEADFERLMEISRNIDVLEWVWLAWRERMQPMKSVYRELVDVENKAAKRNGYSDIGASWREELEIPNLRQKCRSLYEDIKPLYKLLHGVVRFSLRRHYGNVVPRRGPIPAHLLGNLWSQNWESLADMILPDVLSLDDRMTKRNWTVEYMVKRAEDFYISLGLPPMTDKFWQNSMFTRENHSLARCHGTAADMFEDGDFRLLYCSGVSFDDFYVIHHELGHIQYYMAYERQPALFRQANSALHETIGDTIMYAVMTPQHLHRLRLINDSELYNTRELTFENKNRDYSNRQGMLHFGEFNIPILKNNESQYINEIKDSDKVSIEDIIILKQALNKLPQIPFSLLIDEYRWKYFDGSLDFENSNKEFWAMAADIQGIAPTSLRGKEYFDIGAKFHVPDNTPYTRYFLSSFLQHQLFESLCKAAMFGRKSNNLLYSNINLNRCDIYGSKSAGRILKDLMSRGHSQHWRQILKESQVADDISATALKRYYRPLYVLLKKLVKKYNIPIGW